MVLTLWNVLCVWHFAQYDCLHDPVLKISGFSVENKNFKKIMSEILEQGSDNPVLLAIA